MTARLSSKCGDFSKALVPAFLAPPQGSPRAAVGSPRRRREKKKGVTPLSSRALKKLFPTLRELTDEQLAAIRAGPLCTGKEEDEEGEGSEGRPARAEEGKEKSALPPIRTVTNESPLLQFRANVIYGRGRRKADSSGGPVREKRPRFRPSNAAHASDLLVHRVYAHTNQPFDDPDIAARRGRVAERQKMVGGNWS